MSANLRESKSLRKEMSRQQNSVKGNATSANPAKENLRERKHQQIPAKVNLRNEKCYVNRSPWKKFFATWKDTSANHRERKFLRQELSRQLPPVPARPHELPPVQLPSVACRAKVASWWGASRHLILTANRIAPLARETRVVFSILARGSHAPPSPGQNGLR